MILASRLKCDAWDLAQTPEITLSVQALEAGILAQKFSPVSFKLTRDLSDSSSLEEGGIEAGIILKNRLLSVKVFGQAFTYSA